MLKQGEIKRLLREARFKTIIRTVAISALGFVLLSGVILSANAMLLNEIANSRHIDENLLNVVAAPNTYISHHLANDGFLVGQMEYITYRIVGNRPVYDGTQKIKYSIVPVVQNLYGTGKASRFKLKTNLMAVGSDFVFTAKLATGNCCFTTPSSIIRPIGMISTCWMTSVPISILNWLFPLTAATPLKRCRA